MKNVLDNFLACRNLLSLPNLLVKPVLPWPFKLFIKIRTSQRGDCTSNNFNDLNCVKKTKNCYLILWSKLSWLIFEYWYLLFYEWSGSWTIRSARHIFMKILVSLMIIDQQKWMCWFYLEWRQVWTGISPEIITANIA